MTSIWVISKGHDWKKLVQDFVLFCPWIGFITSTNAAPMDGREDFGGKKIQASKIRKSKVCSVQPFVFKW